MEKTELQFIKKIAVFIFGGVSGSLWSLQTHSPIEKFEHQLEQSLAKNETHPLNKSSKMFHPETFPQVSCNRRYCAL